MSPATDGSDDFFLQYLDYKIGKVEVNIFPPLELRVWVCMMCTNDFQSVMTRPFMIDIQCGAASTTLQYTIDNLDGDPHNDQREFDSTYDYNTLY